MDFTWDEAKNRQNMAKHGIAFEAVVPLFSSSDALVAEDRRKDYGETRFVLIGPHLGLYLHVTFTWRHGAIRLISARRANKREQRDHDRRKHNQGRAD